MDESKSNAELHPLGVLAYSHYVNGGKMISEEAIASLSAGLFEIKGDRKQLTDAVVSMTVVLQLARREEREQAVAALTALIQGLRPYFQDLKGQSISEPGGPSESEKFFNGGAGNASARSAPQLGAERPEGSVSLQTFAPIRVR
jgi:hypothetical protein